MVNWLDGSPDYKINSLKLLFVMSTINIWPGAGSERADVPDVFVVPAAIHHTLGDMPPIVLDGITPTLNIVA